MTWLKGGPLYELSFLLPNSTNKEERLTFIFNSMNLFDTIIEFQNNTEDLVLQQRAFIEFEASEDNSVNSIDLDCRIFFNPQRKGRLVIEELSEEFLKLNLSFFGSEYDAEEWHQKGLTQPIKDQLYHLFNNSFSIYEPLIGSIGYEVDVLEFFDTITTCPDKAYNRTNLNLKKISNIFEANTEFEVVFVNEKLITGENSSIMKLMR